MIYRIIRSNRKTFALEMTREGLLVRVPYTATKDQIDRFVDDHRAWIEKHRQKMEDRRIEPSDKLSMINNKSIQLQVFASESITT